jgi:hypothetical protein
MSSPAGVPEDSVDDLYGLPIDEFTQRRDALAKELRSSGQRAAADWVKGLRKPSAAAWVVNQLVRCRPEEAKELVRAGDGLRSAHERIVAGDADADELRSAAEAEHEAARGLLADAPGFLDRDGHAPSPATLERVAQTIRAVALDDDARAEFEAGRLTREHAATGFGPLGAAPPARPAKRAKKAKTKTSTAKPARPGKARAADDKARAARDVARKALSRAEADQRKLARKIQGAERELADAQREAERAQRRLERASADLEDARAREAEADDRVKEAKAQLEG